MIIAAFVLAAGLIVLALAFHVLRQGDPEVEPFRFEDKYTDVPEIQAARSRAMAIPRKHATLRTRNSR